MRYTKTDCVYFSWPHKFTPVYQSIGPKSNIRHKSVLRRNATYVSFARYVGFELKAPHCFKYSRFIPVSWPERPVVLSFFFFLLFLKFVAGLKWAFLYVYFPRKFSPLHSRWCPHSLGFFAARKFTRKIFGIESTPPSLLPPNSQKFQCGRDKKLISCHSYKYCLSGFPHCNNFGVLNYANSLREQ